MSNLSYVTHEGDGATVMFPIAVAGENIGYFRTSDIHVYVDGVEVSFTIDPNSPHLVVLGSAPADGSEVLIRRIMPKDNTYANFERGNNFGQRQVNNSFLQQLYLTQELLDGFWPDGYYWKTDVNAGGKLLKNLGDAVDPNDAVKKETTDLLDERLSTVEEGIFSDSRYIHWLYNDGSAVGGELKVYPPFKFKTISTVYINGVRQTYGLAFDYDTSDYSVELAEELEEGDEVVVAIGTEPKDFVPESHDLLSNRDSVGSHDSIYIRNVTLSEAILEDAPVGTRYSIKEARYDVVDSTDTGGYYIAVMPSGRKLKLITDKTNSVVNFNSLADASTNSVVLNVPIGGFSLTSPILIDGELQSIKGSSGSFDNDVNSVISFVGDGIRLCDTNSVNQSKIQDLKLVGNGTGIGVSKTSGISTSFTDSTISNLRLENFATGLSATYLWSTEITNLRIQNCDKSFDLLSQTNNLVFNNFNATGGNISSRLVNVEGCVINGANISNQSGLYAFTMSQSYLIINSPYFENISNDLVLLGSTAESNPSSLIINGGLLGGDVVIGGNGCYLEINGSRQTNPESTQIKSINTVPDRWVNMSVSYQYVGVQKSSLSPVPILDIKRDRPTFLSGSSGGSVRAVELTPDYYIMRQTASANGVTLTTNLTIGEQYTLVLMVRKELLDGGVSIRSGSRSLGLPESIIPDSGDEWVIRTLPFVPDSSDLRLLYRGDLQIKRISIYKGILNTAEAKEEVPHKFYATGTSLLTGTWADGSRVYNQTPSVDSNNMILDGWCKISGIWQPVYLSNVSPAN